MNNSISQLFQLVRLVMVLTVQGPAGDEQFWSGGPYVGNPKHRLASPKLRAFTTFSQICATFAISD